MTKPEIVFKPLQVGEMTQKHIDEAIAFAVRHDRNLANRNGYDAIPVAAYQLRLLSLVVLQLTGQHLIKPKPEKQQKKKAGKTVTAKVTEYSKISPEQVKVLKAVEKLLKQGKKPSSRKVAEICGYESHNTAAVSIKSLIKAGRLKKSEKDGKLSVG